MANHSSSSSTKSKTGPSSTDASRITSATSSMSARPSSSTSVLCQPSSVRAARAAKWDTHSPESGAGGMGLVNTCVDETFEVIAEPEPAGYREQHLIGIRVDVGQHQTELDLGQPEVGEQRQITGRDDVVEVLVRGLGDSEPFE